jgi:hypothetical protein
MRAISGIGYAYQPCRYGRIPTHDGRNDTMIEGAACMQPKIVPGRVEQPRRLSLSTARMKKGYRHRASIPGDEVCTPMREQTRT